MFIAREPYSVNKSKAVSLVRMGDGQDSSKMEIMELTSPLSGKKVRHREASARKEHCVRRWLRRRSIDSSEKTFDVADAKLTVTHHMGSAIASANFWLLFGHQCLND